MVSANFERLKNYLMDSILLFGCEEDEPVS
jgi:hypothetical protein